MSDWISTKEAMALLGVGSTTIKRWTDDDKLRSMRTKGGHRRFSRSDIDQFLSEQTKPGGNITSARRWIQLLGEQRDYALLRRELTRLHGHFGDWFQSADFLAGVAAQMGADWADGKSSIVEEHIAISTLDLALGIVSASFPIANGAPVCVLATLSREHHALGLSLTRLCMRSAGFDVIWIGVDTPVDELVDYLSKTRPAVLGLSASRWSTDYGFLARAYRELAATCPGTGTELILGGAGAWPEPINVGHLCGSFVQLKDLLAQRPGNLADEHHRSSMDGV